uniref:Cytoskeleton protein RodZ-like C-terminal domain-containing protein n=1 Tax=uncultured Thiotrichaceae bacterium TaxID=298394 RepID=A0A6S6TZU2_9GAMM|nr:MAG: Unknown protein [uncultured Thiotrichaceae bacterium]
MTNKTTEQDMEAESVDNNNATMIEKPTESGDLTTEDTIKSTASELTETVEETQGTTDEAVDEALIPDTEEIDSPDHMIIAPGSLSRSLKRCRDEAGITVEGAAAELRLPLSVLKSLEEENFAELPDPPYIRGYLRSYARLNDSDPTNLINHYETLRGADPKDIASFTPITPRYQPDSKKAVSPTTIKLAGFSMIILLLVVLSMIPAVSQWASDTWKSFSEPQSQKLAAASAQDTEASGNSVTDEAQIAENAANSSDTSTSSNSDTAPADNSEQLPINQPADSDKHNEDVGTNDTDGTAEEKIADEEKTAEETSESASATEAESTETAQEDAAAAEQSTTADSTVTDSTTDTDAATENSAANSEEDGNGETTDDASATAQNAATDTTQDAATEEVAATAQDAATEETATQEQADAEKIAAEAQKAREKEAQQGEQFQQPIDGSVIIRLVFSQPVWMSIKNGRGKTIFSSLNAAGTTQELKATTPLQFKVGNAQGVKIYLNGQLIDQKPYTRGSVSTFRAN